MATASVTTVDEAFEVIEALRHRLESIEFERLAQGLPKNPWAYMSLAHFGLKASNMAHKLGTEGMTALNRLRFDEFVRDLKAYGIDRDGATPREPGGGVSREEWLERNFRLSQERNSELRRELLEPVASCTATVTTTCSKHLEPSTTAALLRDGSRTTSGEVRRRTTSASASVTRLGGCATQASSVDPQRRDRCVESLGGRRCLVRGLCVGSVAGGVPTSSATASAVASSTQRHGGSFRTEADAKKRQKWIDGEMANMRTPDLRLLVEASDRPTLAKVAAQWRASRIDVSEATRTTHAVNLARILPRIGTKAIDDLTAADVAGLVTALVEQGLARESMRKTISTLAQVLDFAKVTPNPARDKAVKLPRVDSVEPTPPTADHVEAVHAILSGVNRLALVVLDATGMRISELEAALWGDVDEPAGRWRVRKEAAKTRRGRWVPVVPVELFDAIMDTVPREDRDLAGQMLAGFGADRFRTALGRACKAAGVPGFSPHDLRHRRATMWHMQGVPVAEAAAWLGHSPTEHLRTYAHASLSDRAEVDHVALVRGPVVFAAEEVAA